jgi:raffinose/stachyose/melibiose transport system substrate-binding protein
MKTLLRSQHSCALFSGVAIGALLMTSAAFAQSTTLRILAPASGTGQGITKMAEKFKQERGDIDVQIQQVPSGENYAQAMLTQLQAGAASDILFTNSGWGAPESVMPLGEAGHLEDLSAQPWAADFPESRVPEDWLNGKLLGLPLSMTNIGLVYNQKLYDELGLTVPKTFDELLEVCKAADAKGKRAIGVSGSSSFYFYQSVALSTVFAENPNWSQDRADGKVTFSDTPGWHEALERVEAMKQAYCFPLGVQAVVPPQLFADIAAGNVISAVGPTSLMGAVKGMAPDIDLRLTAFPGTSADDTLAMGIFNDTLSVNANAENKEAALAFLEFLATPENMAEYSVIAGGTAPADVAAGVFPEALSDLSAFYTSDKVFSVPHHSWKAAEVRGTLIADGSAFFADTITIEKFLADLDAAWR